jgi:hypothetical protein
MRSLTDVPALDGTSARQAASRIPPGAAKVLSAVAEAVTGGGLGRGGRLAQRRARSRGAVPL